MQEIDQKKIKSYNSIQNSKIRLNQANKGSKRQKFELANQHIALAL